MLNTVKFLQNSSNFNWALNKSELSFNLDEPAVCILSRKIVPLAEIKRRFNKPNLFFNGKHSLSF